MTTLFDWFVPRGARADAAMAERFRGVAKALLGVSAVGLLALLGYLALIERPPVHEVMLFTAGIVIATLGAVLMRFTANITLSLLVTNVAGISLIAAWAYLSGGITSPAAIWMLALMAGWVSFGSRAQMVWAGAFVSLCALTLYVATARGWVPPSIMNPVNLPLYSLIAYVSAALLLMSAALATHAGRERVKRRLREAQIRAEDEKARAEDARARAEQANRAKSVFLSSMSHELRTPLNAVIGFAEVLDYPENNTLTAEQREYVRHILTSGEHLLALITQVLDMSQMESGNLRIVAGKVSPAPVIEAAVEMLAAAARRDQVTVTLDIADAHECILWADGQRLRQVLWNLVSNAIKFNHAGGNVRVWAQRSGQTLRIGVTDNGPGIATARHAEVFEPFARLGAEGTTVSGAGLGLAVSRRIVQMMGGQMGFTSERGAGAEFWVDVPLVNVEKLAEASSRNL